MFSSSLAVETILVSSTWSGSANTQRLRPMRDSSTESTHGSRKGGRRITIEAMNRALHAIGWTHKKRRPSPASETRKQSKRDATLS